MCTGDIYISESGSDTESCGTELDPCQSMKGALNKSPPNGTTFIFESGVYDGENNTGFTFLYAEYSFLAQSDGVQLGCGDTQTIITSSSISFINITFICDVGLFLLNYSQVGKNCIPTYSQSDSISLMPIRTGYSNGLQLWWHYRVAI